MTARRNFKKAVRERMSRTGETYSTAARHLTGPIAVRPGAHRESVLVGHLLGAAGRAISEAMVCGLGGGIGFMYAVFEYAAVPHPLLTIVAQHHPQPWAPAVLDRLGWAYRQTSGSSTKAALDRLATALDSGRPALCTVDRTLLPWHDSGPFTQAEPYTVVVTASAGGVLTVLDPPYGSRQLTITDFAPAWASHRQGRHHLLCVDDALSTPDLPAAVRDALGTTVAHLTGPVLGNSFDVNFGFSGMAKFAAELRDGRTRKGWTQRFATPAGREHAHRRLPECLQREYTAPGATRPLYAAFLDEAATLGLSDLARLTSAAELFRESGQGWSALADHAAQADAEADLRDWCDQAAELVEANLAIEREATVLLSAAIAGREGASG